MLSFQAQYTVISGIVKNEVWAIVRHLVDLEVTRVLSEGSAVEGLPDDSNGLLPSRRRSMSGTGVGVSATVIKVRFTSSGLAHGECHPKRLLRLFTQ